MNDKCIHRYMVDDNDNILPSGFHGQVVHRTPYYAYTLCNCGVSDTTPDPVLTALKAVLCGDVADLSPREDQTKYDDEESGKVVPSIPDMMYDVFANPAETCGDQHYHEFMITVAEEIRKELNDLMAWPDYVGFQGGGRVFLAVPKQFLK